MTEKELTTWLTKHVQDSINAIYENEMLKQRIDKATEEIEKLSKLYEDNYTISDKAKDIIDILKGE